MVPCYCCTELKEAVATYKNSKKGEMKMSSIWKEVEDEGKAKRSSEIARNLLVQKILSTEEIAEVTGLSLDEVNRIKSQMKM